MSIRLILALIIIATAGCSNLSDEKKLDSHQRQLYYQNINSFDSNSIEKTIKETENPSDKNALQLIYSIQKGEQRETSHRYINASDSDWPLGLHQQVLRYFKVLSDGSNDFKIERCKASEEILKIQVNNFEAKHEMEQTCE